VDASIIVAIIALIASVLSGGLAIYGQMHSLAIEARREAEATLSRYREPLLGGARDLWYRLDNILRDEFLEAYYANGDEQQREYAIKSTLYLLGQYFAWTEILRRRIQFLDFGEVRKTREVSDLLEAVRTHFDTDRFKVPSIDTNLLKLSAPFMIWRRFRVPSIDNDVLKVSAPFMIWRAEQRAIGERMIVEQDGELLCMGYAAFVEQTDPAFLSWFEPLERDIEIIAGHPRMRVRLEEVQKALLNLIARLDPEGIRSGERINRVRRSATEPRSIEPPRDGLATVRER
jgi:hypothetical protein